MGQGSIYALDKLVLELHAEKQTREDLDHLLQESSWVRTPGRTARPDLRLFVSSKNREFRIPQNCREVLRTSDFLGFEGNDDFYLTDGASVFHLQPTRREGYAHLAPSFFAKPKLAQSNFWCFGLLKLLRAIGIYSLHAAALADRDGAGLFLVGASGSGKSTLAIGLIREGWKYLSDDAVLLRYGSGGVEALANRRSFYIDAARYPDYGEFLLCEEVPDSNGGKRRRVRIDEAWPEQYLRRCVPHVVIFPQIKPQVQSTLKPSNSVRALKLLLAQSGPQLFDRSTMAQHLELLKRLLQQTETYELTAGRDLYHKPARLMELMQAAQGGKNWRASSLS